jgi:hypothetical protein
MSIFDLLNKVQSATIEKVEMLQKKIEETAEQLTVATLANPKEKNKAAPNKNKKKPAQKKPDLSVEGISVHIIKQRDNIKKNGFRHYEFIANRDCCATCAALDGKHFPISKLKIGVNAPPMHDGCSCSIAAWEDPTEYEAWLDFVSKGGTTKQWEAMKKKKR